MCMCDGVHGAKVHMWKSENDTVEFVLSFIFMQFWELNSSESQSL